MAALAARRETKSNRYEAVQERYESFKAEYRMNGGNATQAAISAGYSAKTAHVIGSQLVRRLKVQEGAEARSTETLEKSLLTEERLAKELERIAFFDPRKLFDSSGRLLDPSQWSDDVAAGIASLDRDEITAGPRGKSDVVGQTTKIRLWDKLGAIEKAMRYRGMFERDNRQRSEAISLEVQFTTAPARPSDDARVVEGQATTDDGSRGKKPGRG